MEHNTVRYHSVIPSSIVIPSKARDLALMQRLPRRLRLLAMTLFITMTTTLLTACGFHLQGEQHLAPPLHNLYVQAQDPYGPLARYLEEFLKMSNVKLVATPEQATTNLVIQNDSTSQALLSVSGTQQTRQYNLGVNVTFYVSDTHGKALTPAQTFNEVRTITIQSNQILGSSNEATLIYQQIRRSLAIAILYHLSSEEITTIINKEFQPVKKVLAKQKRR